MAERETASASDASTRPSGQADNRRPLDMQATTQHNNSERIGSWLSPLANQAASQSTPSEATKGCAGSEDPGSSWVAQSPATDAAASDSRGSSTLSQAGNGSQPALRAFMSWGAKQSGFPYGSISYWVGVYEQATGVASTQEQAR